MPQIKAKQETRLKESLADSSTLGPHQLIKCVAGKVLNVSAIKPASGGHVEVIFSPPINIKLGGVDYQWDNGFIFTAHWDVPQMAGAVAPGSVNPIPADKALTWKQWMDSYQAWVKTGGGVISPAAAPVITQGGSTAPPGEIEIKKQTWLKSDPVDSSTLSANNKTMVQPGKMKAKVIGAKAGHTQLELPDGSKRWIFSLHFEGQETANGTNAVGREFFVPPDKLLKAIKAIAASGIDDKECARITDAIIEMAPKSTITKREHLIHFLSQVGHESGQFMYTSECGGPSYFAMYDDRDDLGNTYAEAYAAADKKGVSTGTMFRGRSLIQTTGYSNYYKYGKFAGIDAVNNPELLEEYPHAMGGAMFFWMSQGPTLSQDAEGGINEATCRAITKVVNGGQNGIEHRLQLMWQLDKLL